MALSCFLVAFMVSLLYGSISSSVFEPSSSLSMEHCILMTLAWSEKLRFLHGRVVWWVLANDRRRSTVETWFGLKRGVGDVR
jgi:hypothetical protein